MPTGVEFRRGEHFTRMAREPKPPGVRSVCSGLQGNGSETKFYGNGGAFAVGTACDDVKGRFHPIAYSAVSDTYEQWEFTLLF